MARKLFVALISIGVVLVLAAPAGAKGISYAHFTGPGLPAAGLTIEGRTEQEVGPLWQTGVLEEKGVPRDMMGLTDDELGPAYRAAYRFDFARGQMVHQTLYPYAKGGPWSYTPSQPLRHFGSLPAGWYHGTTVLLHFLVKNGFPRQAPDSGTVEVRTASTKTSGAGMSGWAWVLVAAGGALVLGGTTVATRRLRRVR